MKRLKLYMILGFLFTAVLGTIWHFLYDWTGRGAIAALFFPVNESTWEHMKLIFFPMLLCTVFLAARFKEEYPCLPGALLAGNLLGTLSIPVTFYTYKGIGRPQFPRGRHCSVPGRRADRFPNRLGPERIARRLPVS